MAVTITIVALAGTAVVSGAAGVIRRARATPVTLPAEDHVLFNDDAVRAMAKCKPLMEEIKRLNEQVQKSLAGITSLDSKQEKNVVRNVLSEGVKTYRQILTAKESAIQAMGALTQAIQKCQQLAQLRLDPQTKAQLAAYDMLDSFNEAERRTEKDLLFLQGSQEVFNKRLAESQTSLAQLTPVLDKACGAYLSPSSSSSWDKLYPSKWGNDPTANIATFEQHLEQDKKTQAAASSATAADPQPASPTASAVAVAALAEKIASEVTSIEAEIRAEMSTPTVAETFIRGMHARLAALRAEVNNDPVLDPWLAPIYKMLKSLEQAPDQKAEKSAAAGTQSAKPSTAAAPQPIASASQSAAAAGAAVAAAAPAVIHPFRQKAASTTDSTALSRLIQEGNAYIALNSGTKRKFQFEAYKIMRMFEFNEHIVQQVLTSLKSGAGPH